MLGFQNWIDDGYDRTHFAYVLMHELGHAFGIDSHPPTGGVMMGSRFGSEKNHVGYRAYWPMVDLTANI